MVSTHLPSIHYCVLCVVMKVRVYACWICACVSRNFSEWAYFIHVVYVRSMSAKKFWEWATDPTSTNIVA